MDLVMVWHFSCPGVPYRAPPSEGMEGNSYLPEAVEPASALQSLRAAWLPARAGWPRLEFGWLAFSSAGFRLDFGWILGWIWLWLGFGWISV